MSSGPQVECYYFLFYFIFLQHQHYNAEYHRYHLSTNI